MKPNNPVRRLLGLEDHHLEVWLNADNKVCVAYTNCEVKMGVGFLKTEYGVGNTFYDACEDYFDRISGKTLVFDSQSPNRKEVIVL